MPTQYTTIRVIFWFACWVGDGGTYRAAGHAYCGRRDGLHLPRGMMLMKYD
ncbi:MAG: hypothetical protein R2795_23120 [Saprospiraceae bacterium]